jgi:hypothetical protein
MKEYVIEIYPGSDEGWIRLDSVTAGSEEDKLADVTLRIENLNMAWPSLPVRVVKTEVVFEYKPEKGVDYFG